MRKEKFTDEENEILKLFQTAENRSAEEIFAQFVSGKDETRLFFINEDMAYTDGKNIVVDPALYKWFSDKDGLFRAEEMLEISHDFSCDMWNALAVLTRGQTLHECLHIVYTKFPSYLTDAKRFDTKPKQFAIHEIENIIEDAFIENAGATLFDNISFYLKFNNVMAFTSSFHFEGTMRKIFKQINGDTSLSKMEEYEKAKKEKSENPEIALELPPEPSELKLFAFLEFMGVYADYPFIELGEPPKMIAEYFEKAKPLIDEAVVCGNAKKRSEICSEIYEIIKDLIPDGDKIPESPTLEKIHKGSEKTHKGNYFGNPENSFEPKEIKITKKLFEKNDDETDGENGDNPNGKLNSGEPKNPDEKSENPGEKKSENPDSENGGKLNSGENGDVKLNSGKPKNPDKKSEKPKNIILHLTPKQIEELKKFISEQKTEKEKAQFIITIVPKIENIDASKFDFSGIHKGIKIKQVKPATNRALEAAYKKIVQKYSVSINTWSKRFFEIVKGEREIEEDKLFFGTKISSEHLGDIKKRYWKKSIVQQGSPELAILIMIDGSGSMYGERQKAAINSCVILHEVLKRQEIEHCVVDYKAIYDEDKVVHNVLLDFNAKKMDCLNLLSFEPDEGTRDGISMLWAEKYIAQNSSAENKLIIVISDGVPEHFGKKAKDYYDEIAIKDSAECAKKIQQRGTKIVGVALDNNKGNNSFETLKQIYKNSIKCTDLNKLTRQLLEIIAKQVK